MLVGDLIKKLEPYKDFELVPKLHLYVKEEILDKRNYKFPHDSFGAEVEIDDIGHSDNVLLLGITPKSESED